MRRVRENPSVPAPRASFETVSWGTNLARQLSSLLAEYAFRINRTLPKDGSEPMASPLPVASFTAATLPDATAWEGAVIYVSDGSAGQRFRGSNGTTWVNLG